MADQVAAWLDPAAVADQAGVELDGAGALPASAERARLAAAAWVERARRDLVTPAVYDVDGVTVITPAGYAAPPDVQLGAAMLAARWLARKGSPQGLASFGEFGPAAVLRIDPDVERLLGIGRSGRPVAR